MVLVSNNAFFFHLILSQYCQKVWLTLEEKKIPYRVEKINVSTFESIPGSWRDAILPTNLTQHHADDT